MQVFDVFITNKIFTVMCPTELERKCGFEATMSFMSIVGSSQLLSINDIVSTVDFNTYTHSMLLQSAIADIGLGYSSSVNQSVITGIQCDLGMAWSSSSMASQLVNSTMISSIGMVTKIDAKQLLSIGVTERVGFEDTIKCNSLSQVNQTSKVGCVTFDSRVVVIRQKLLREVTTLTIGQVKDMTIFDFCNEKIKY